MDINDFEASSQTPRVYVVRWPHRSHPSLIFNGTIAELEVLVDAVGGRDRAESSRSTSRSVFVCRP